jgi:hypothetical protein
VLRILLIALLFISLAESRTKAEPAHHENEAPPANEKDSHVDHDHDSKDIGKGHEHGHDESGDNIGPDKGILEASAKDGIKLSKEALARFGIKTQRLNGRGPWMVPISARVQSGEEVNVFRARGEFYKRIDFSTIKTSFTHITIRTSDLREGDQIVIEGVGFLRIAEVVAFGGAPEGHSH